MADKMKKALAEYGAKLEDTVEGAIGKTNGLRTAGLIAGSVIVGASLLDYLMNRQDEVRKVRQTKIQEDDLQQQQKDFAKYKNDAYTYLQGLPQQLYNNRIGHTNSWGGRNY